MAAAEVEAECLQRPQPPGVEHLRLLDHVARFDIAVVVHVGADEVQAEGAQHVGADQHHHGDVHHLHGRQGRGRPGNGGTEGGAGPVEQVEAEGQVPGRPVEQAQRRVDLQRAAEDQPAVRRILRPQPADQRAHHVVADHQQAGDAPGFAVGDGAFLGIRLAAGHLVMVQVQVPAHPGVDGARPGQPDQRHHQVVRHGALAEVHRVDQVVLQLVGQRGEEGVEQQARPPGQLAADVQGRRTEHAEQGEGENSGAERVLMLQDRVALCVAVGHHLLADMRGALLIIKACGGGGHADILLLLGCDFTVP